MHAILRLPDVKRSSRKLVFELSNYLRYWRDGFGTSEF